MTNRYMAVDPGDARIGVALSDLTGTIASGHSVIKHVSRTVDAALIAQIASENDVVGIIIGLALDSSGETGSQARKALRLAEAVRTQTEIPVIMWDESYSTQAAQDTQRLLKIPSRKRKDTIDLMAAVVILQSYLEKLADKRNKS